MLYHWQRFVEDRLAQTLEDLTIYCSSPNEFNDPWDSKPFFNTEILNNPEEKRNTWLGPPTSAVAEPRCLRRTSRR